MGIHLIGVCLVGGCSVGVHLRGVQLLGRAALTRGEITARLKLQPNLLPRYFAISRTISTPPIIYIN
jgi:hypothetical protein